MIIISINNNRMVIEVDKDKYKFKYLDPLYLEYQRQYRKKYYQENKDKIKKYQQVYLIKRGYKSRVSWKGEKITKTTKTYGNFIITFD
mgnify:CR=1 FL=1